MSFAGARPSDAYLCGSIKCRPYFQLAVSAYEGEITLTVNQYGDAADRERIIAFLRDIGQELREACGSQVPGFGGRSDRRAEVTRTSCQLQN